MLPTYRVVALVVDVFMDKSLEPKQNTSNHLSSKTGNLDTCEKMNLMVQEGFPPTNLWQYRNPASLTMQH